MVSVSSIFLRSAARDGYCETCALVLANRKRKQTFGEGLAMTGFSPAEEMALWQIRGRPVIDGTILDLSSEKTGISIGKPIATGISAVLSFRTFLSFQARLHKNL